MTGLVLEGGGTRGAYQAGAYLAFLECGITFDGVCGTSIGAVNGAIIASGKGADLPRIWREIDPKEVLGFQRSWQDVVDIIRHKGIALKGIRDLMAKEIDLEALLTSPVDFGLVTVRLKDLKPICLFKEEMGKEKISDYIIASLSLPIFRLDKIIDDNYYLDGGFYDVSPVNMLLEKGYQKIYLVKNRGIGIHRKYTDTAEVIVIEPKRSLGHILELDKKQIAENIKMGYYDALRVLKNLDGYNYVFKSKKDKFYQRLNKKIAKREYRRVSSFLGSKSEKETVIKAVEYILEKEKVNYYQVYNFRKILRKIKKDYTKDHFIYNYVRRLRSFF